ncbi:MAG TPA: hypothetical protein PKA88_32910 [Polyangiaceae bacterium]|nr:hypothetical protein [Polyangiaceae bacterium]
MRRSLIAAVSLFAFLAACGGGAEPPQTADVTPPEPAPVEPAPEPPAEPEEAPPPPPVPTATEVVTAGSTFMFSFADSDVKQATEEACEKSSKKDEAKMEACVAKVADAGAKEGIRFEKDEEGGWWWVSFGDAKGKEQIFNKVKFTIAGEEGRTLKLKPEGKDAGKRPMKKLPEEVVIEVPDETTVIMTDPKKGKLVYKKS